MRVLEASPDPEIVFDPSFMRCRDDAGRAAMGQLHEYVHRNHVEVVLQAGDLLLFDNRRVAHARGAYTPRYDGSDRWLLRTVVLESLWKARSSRQGDGLLVN